MQGVADQNHHAAVVTVSYMAGRQQEQESGQKKGQPGIPQIERAVSDFIHLPSYGHRLRFCAHDDHHPCQLVAAKVAVGKCCCTCCR